MMTDREKAQQAIRDGINDAFDEITAKAKRLNAIKNYRPPKKKLAVKASDALIAKANAKNAEDRTEGSECTCSAAKNRKKNHADKCPRAVFLVRSLTGRELTRG